MTGRAKNATTPQRGYFLVMKTKYALMCVNLTRKKIVLKTGNYPSSLNVSILTASNIFFQIFEKNPI